MDDTISRDELYNKIDEFANNRRNDIISQLQIIGVEANWEREQYTISDKYKALVRNSFIKLYTDGLIYHGLYPINYCTHCSTSLSDDEIVYIDKLSTMYYIKYEVKNNENIIIATTRPETIFADVAVINNMNISGYCKVPLINKQIPIIADVTYIDDQYKHSSGFMKITGAHCKLDYRICRQYSLEIINIIGKDGNIYGTGTELDGMNIHQARKKIVCLLKKNNYIEKENSVENRIPTCYRCSNIIEIIVDNQWFIKMSPFIELIKNNLSYIDIYPKGYYAMINDWLKKCDDWCISRQIVWGHKIPIIYCSDCNNIDLDDTLTCSKCKSTNRKLESDVLDTWFSSALWAFGCFDSEEEIDKYVPINIMVTGGDIIFFWVARMIMFTLYFKNKISFKKVYLHGIVRDSKGEKMSKTKGNVVDPCEIVEKYGSDCLRFALFYDLHEGNDVNISETNFKIAKRLNLKIMNSSILMKQLLNSNNEESDTNPLDHYIYTKILNLEKTIDCYINQYAFGNACKDIYEFFFNIFCNIYLEFIKKNGTKNHIIKFIYCKILNLIYLFMPKIVNTIKSDLLLTNDIIKNIPTFTNDIEKANVMMDIIHHIRSNKTKNKKNELDENGKIKYEIINITLDAKYRDLCIKYGSSIIEMCGLYTRYVNYIFI